MCSSDLNTIIASCQAKIDWKRQRKRENIKIIIPFRSVPTRPVREHSKKKAQKFKKLKNTIMASFLAKIRRRRLRNREYKFYRFVTFLTDEFQKNSEKIKKHHYGIISSQNWLEKAEKETK